MARESNVNKKAIGHRIRQIRGTLTQKEFANKIGTRQNNISHYETGVMLPPLDRFIRIAEAYSVSLDWLITGKISKHRSVPVFSGPLPRRGRQKRFPPETEKRIVQLYQTGLGMPAIGKRCNASHSTIRGILDRHGIKRRPRGGKN